jgi:nitrogen fixation NifU-like protein
MSDLRELYQEVILDHSKKPRNLREMQDASGQAQGYNPLCGDRATVYVRLEGDVVKDVSFVGQGCSISTASASIMTEVLRGKTVAEADALFERFHALVTASPDQAGKAAEDPALGKLAVFAGVCEFPVRVKCASLAWHTLKQALEAPGAARRQPVSTE